MNAQFAAFSVADYYQTNVDVNWFKFKLLGNNLFALKDYEKAIASYTDAFFIAKGYDAIVPFLLENILNKRNHNSALYKAAQVPHVVMYIKQFLNKPWRTYLNGLTGPYMTFPNLPVAICLSNRAMCYLNIHKQIVSEGNVQELRSLLKLACRDAANARKACPTYVKSHHLYMKALKIIGNTYKYNNVKNQIESYSSLLAVKHLTEGIAAFMLGWIELVDLEFVYTKLRCNEAIRQIKALSVQHDATKVPRVSVQASMVPLAGGQFLSISLDFRTVRLQNITFNTVVLSVLDSEHGNDLELPPNGLPTEMALTNAMKDIKEFFENMKEEEFNVMALILGQGLVGRQEQVRQVLRESEVFEEKDVDGLYIYNSALTWAAEKAMRGV